MALLSQSGFSLTISLPLLVEQNALHWGPNQHSSTSLLNHGDDVKGKLTGTPPRIICTSLVVMKKESIDEEAGFFRRDTYNDKR